ncbi:hypothetical protein GLAREA_02643 [Glarea lozoyensis ATCC 20868]|uniref:Uncharacterized protein n=1 Tax=Glarea lozoyensis (strain ATCC 20868 / MF5171) TaxID=1116229 RepID=S3CNI0_GLAL2|nr:uncharacterized protein GLAREA_02643 [Glarea lozoyensis ATCC 20868]EPE26729.1 hypothetical protein GLAREA_02643 [Glarea lozoyensis ATCC 20868]
MVFDPLSVIGYVGTAAGLVGFLVSTVTRIEQYQRDFRDAAFKLNWYEDRLTSVEGEMTAWGRLWCGGYSEDDYQSFWGRKGFDSVQRKMTLIQHEVNGIGLLLYGQVLANEDGQVSGIVDRDWEHWKLQLQKLRSVDLISRIFFASFRGANLKERTSELEKMVSNLKSDTQRLLFEIQFRPTTNPTVDDDVLQRVLDRKAWVDEHKLILTKLFNLSRQWGKWSLVLRPPDEQGEPSSIDGGNGIKIEFDALSAVIDGQNTRDLGIVDFHPSQFLRTNPTINQWYSDEARDANRRVPTREDYLVARFTITRGRRETGYRQQLARAAIGLVNWTMLLWNTPWTDGICSCQLRFVTFRRKEINITVATFAAANTCEKTRRPHIMDKSLLMGISLAELAIMQSVTVNLCIGEATNFSVGGKTITEKELLDYVKTRNGPGYRSAVWYCFEYSRKLERGEGFRPHDILVFKENVIKRYDDVL